MVFPSNRKRSIGTIRPIPGLLKMPFDLNRGLILWLASNENPGGDIRHFASAHLWGGLVTNNSSVSMDAPHGWGTPFYSTSILFNWNQGDYPLNGDDFSASMWYAGEGGTNDSLMVWGDTSTASGRWAWHLSDAVMKLSTRPDGGTNVPHSIGTAPFDLTSSTYGFAHLAFTRNSATGLIKGFVNGQSIGSVTGQTGQCDNAMATKNGTIPKAENGMHDICVWNRELKDTEVYQQYLASIQGYNLRRRPLYIPAAATSSTEIKALRRRR